MPYRIHVSPTAELDRRSLRKREEQTVRPALPRYLTHEPSARSTKRRPLDPNPFDADWELRLGDLRVLYAIPLDQVGLARLGLRLEAAPGHRRTRPFCR